MSCNKWGTDASRPQGMGSDGKVTCRAALLCFVLVAFVMTPVSTAAAPIPSVGGATRLDTASEGPGLLERNKQRFYLPALDGRRRTETQLPPIDLVAFRRPWGLDSRARLTTVALLDGWQGGPLAGTGAANRYEIAFLLGRFCRAVHERFGELFEVSLGGPRQVRLPRLGWGGRDVRLAVRSKLLPVNGGNDWWLRPVSWGRFVRILHSICGRLRRHTPIVELPLRFPPPGSGLGVPLPPDPRYQGLREVYRWGLYDIAGSRWDVRASVPRKNVLEAMDRLVFMAWGYREPEQLERPGGDYPAPR